MERYQMLEPAERQKQKYNGQNHPVCVLKKNDNPKISKNNR
jgi:hypothetical protein